MRWFACAIALLMNCSAAYAQIVAFGASAVLGWGVPPAESYPAQLEGVLRAKGTNVAVINAGVYDDTPASWRASTLLYPSSDPRHERRGVQRFTPGSKSCPEPSEHCHHGGASRCTPHCGGAGGDIGFTDELSAAGSHPSDR
jgi:hypothetical protein